MGNQQGIEYTVPVSEKKQGESPIYRSPQNKQGFLNGPSHDVTQMKTAILKASATYANKNCLGTIVRTQGQPSTIKYLSYKEVVDQAYALGSGIINQKLQFVPEGENLSFVGIFSKNRAEWTIVDIACILFKITTVPLYDTLGDENITYVLDHTKLATIFVNSSSLKALMKCQDLVDVKNIVCFDAFTSEEEQYFKQKGVTLRKYQQLLTIGKNNPQNYKDQKYRVDPKDCITFCYTSGTTGPPKGAMLSHKNFCSFVAVCQQHEDVQISSQDIVLSYLPLPHVLQRQLLYVLLSNGGTAVYSSGDITKIKDDIEMVKPTLFVGVPRVYSRFYDVMKKKISQLNLLTKLAFDHALNVKINNTTNNGGYTHKVYDPLFFNKTKAALGGNVRLLISGSAPILPQVQKFFKVVMCAPFIEAYGQTESTGASIATNSRDRLVGHVGGPLSNIQVKLVDIPQMKYTSQDKDQNGNPTPRGEIWFRGPGVFLGYYKNQQKTKEALTEDGWLRTGDVAMILPENKGIKLIDRKKNIFKLSQGEYVAPEKIQNVYCDCPLISQIFLTGQSSESFAVAIITADKKKLEQKAAELGVKGSYEEICKDVKVRTQVLKEMNEFGKKKGLKGFEQARSIYIQPKTFQQRQIVTTTMKVQRHEARNVYKKQVEAMYKEGQLGGNKQ